MSEPSLNDHPKFCANPLCRLHIDVGPEACFASVVKGGEQVRVDRHVVKSESKPEVTLCSVCLNVLNLI